MKPQQPITEIEAAKEWWKDYPINGRQHLKYKYFWLEVNESDNNILHIYRKEVIEPWIKNTRDYFPNNINYEAAFEAYYAEVLQPEQTISEGDKETVWEKGDRMSHPKWGTGFVRKVSDYGVHFTLDKRGTHLVGHFNPNHHSQTPISEFTKDEPTTTIANDGKPKRHPWKYRIHHAAMADTGDYESYIEFTNGLDVWTTSGDDIDNESQCQQFCDLLNLMPDLWSKNLDHLEFMAAHSSPQPDMSESHITPYLDESDFSQDVSNFLKEHEEAGDMSQKRKNFNELVKGNPQSDFLDKVKAMEEGKFDAPVRYRAKEMHGDKIIVSKSIWEQPQRYGCHLHLYVQDGDEEIEDTGWVWVNRQTLEIMMPTPDALSVTEGENNGWIKVNDERSNLPKYDDDRLFFVGTMFDSGFQMRGGILSRNGLFNAVEYEKHTHYKPVQNPGVPQH